MRTALPAAVALCALVACRPDDFLVADSGRGAAAADSAVHLDTAGIDALAGDWVSADGDVSAVLVTYYDIASIEVTFDAGGSYTTHMVDGSGSTYDAVGTWTAGAGTVRAITLTQTSPDAATFAGIFGISDDEVLTYEVVQTEPALAGVAAPTVDGGFGSTGGVAEGENVQTYRRP